MAIVVVAINESIQFSCIQSLIGRAAFGTPRVPNAGVVAQAELAGSCLLQCRSMQSWPVVVDLYLSSMTRPPESKRPNPENRPPTLTVEDADQIQRWPINSAAGLSSYNRGGDAMSSKGFEDRSIAIEDHRESWRYRSC